MRLPNYRNRVSSLFYAAWYHPMQVALAYYILEKLIADEGRLTESHQLHVIDFGCGQFALAFAIAIFMSEYYEQNKHIQTITVEAYDSSGVMIDLGRRLWQRFRKRVDGALPWQFPTQEALSRITLKPLGASGEIEARQGIETWLVAMHIMYREHYNNHVVKENLKTLYDRLMPSVGVITFHNSWPQRLVESEISPFAPIDYKRSSAVEFIDRPCPDLNHTPLIWQWLRDLPYEFQRMCWMRKSGPRWCRTDPDEVALIYKRRSLDCDVEGHIWTMNHIYSALSVGTCKGCGDQRTFHNVRSEHVIEERTWTRRQRTN